MATVPLALEPLLNLSGYNSVRVNLAMFNSRSSRAGFVRDRQGNPTGLLPRRDEPNPEPETSAVAAE
jgi:hypothetical protein